MNKPALNESRDIHFGLSTTKATTRKRGTPLSLTDFAKKEISDRNKGKVVIGDHVD